jgi:hypothetical protein
MKAKVRSREKSISEDRKPRTTWMTRRTAALQTTTGGRLKARSRPLMPSLGPRKAGGQGPCDADRKKGDRRPRRPAVADARPASPLNLEVEADEDGTRMAQGRTSGKPRGLLTLMSG